MLNFSFVLATLFNRIDLLDIIELFFDIVWFEALEFFEWKKNLAEGFENLEFRL